MNVFLASAGVPAEHSAINTWRQLARAGSRHHVVDDPSAADVVLFTECHQLGSDWKLTAIRDSWIARSFPHRVMVYDQRDRPWLAFPGAYVSMPSSSFETEFQVAAGYVPVPGSAALRVAGRDLLVSFVGAATHPVRHRIFATSHPRALFEEALPVMFVGEETPEHRSRRTHFRETIARSSFVLCPRGHGTTTFRLFEVMAAARVPVVISDEWVPTAGPAWDRFSLQWPENRSIDELLQMLEGHESDATEMGLLAAEAFHSHFASDVVFDRVMDGLAEMVSRDGLRRFPTRGRRNRAYWRLVAAENLGRRVDRLRAARR
jgi:hypothetical protein